MPRSTASSSSRRLRARHTMWRRCARAARGPGNGGVALPEGARAAHGGLGAKVRCAWQEPGRDGVCGRGACVGLVGRPAADAARAPMRCPPPQAFINTAREIYKKIQDGIFDVSNEVPARVDALHVGAPRGLCGPAANVWACSKCVHPGDCPVQYACEQLPPPRCDQPSAPPSCAVVRHQGGLRRRRSQPVDDQARGVGAASREQQLLLKRGSQRSGAPGGPA